MNLTVDHAHKTMWVKCIRGQDQGPWLPPQTTNVSVNMPWKITKGKALCIDSAPTFMKDLMVRGFHSMARENSHENYIKFFYYFIYFIITLFQLFYFMPCLSCETL